MNTIQLTEDIVRGMATGRKAGSHPFNTLMDTTTRMFWEAKGFPDPMTEVISRLTPQTQAFYAPSPPAPVAEVAPEPVTTYAVNAKRPPQSRD